MEDVPYGRILREGWIIILLATILGGAIAYGITRPMPKTYAATSTLLLQVESTQTSLFERNQFSQARIKSYPVLVDSPTVVGGVRSDLGLDSSDYSDRDIRRMLSATNATDTVLMDVRADAPTAEMAAEMANSAAAHMSELIEATENDESDERYVVSLVQALPAVPPLTPISPQVLPITGLGIVTGLAAGALIALYRTTTNRRIITIADVRRASGLPVLGQIPRTARFRRTRSHVQEARDSAYAETVSNLIALAGPQQRVFVLVPTEPDAIGADALTGLVDAYARAGRRAHVLDTRRNRFPLGQFGSLDELILRSDAATADEADAYLAQQLDESLASSIHTSSVVTVDVLETALPELVRRFDDARDVVLVVVAPGAPSVIAAVDAPMVIGVRSRATTISDLLALSIRSRVMDVRPLGVLITGARSRLRASVSLTWRESDRLEPSDVPDASSPAPASGLAGDAGERRDD